MFKPDIVEITSEITFYDIAEFFKDEEQFVFLDSRENVNNLGLYSFISFAPFFKVRSKNDIVKVQFYNQPEQLNENDVFDIIRLYLNKFKFENDTDTNRDFPFTGGALGYFSYELGRQLEVLPQSAIDDLQLPDCNLGYYNFTLIFDHRKNKIFLSHFNPEVECKYPSINDLLDRIKSVKSYHSTNINSEYSDQERVITADFTKQQYSDAVNCTKDYIIEGDIYQANITQRFSSDVKESDSWILYKKLMEINPSPFGAYLNFTDGKILSSSPERFWRICNNVIETRPIKGTVKRGKTKLEDLNNREWLINSEKNRAELAMIVDLLRNDIGKVSKIGTVKVKSFPEIETYSSVHHLVSTITGELEDGKDVVDLLKSTFPGGSITGAPKIRSMEIIDELEPIVRGIYTGSIGYLGFNGQSDLNIVIRTIILKNNKAYIQAGCGITADSDAEDEYDESILKAKRLFQAIGIYEYPHEK